jgi:hypothetical protein
MDVTMPVNRHLPAWNESATTRIGELIDYLDAIGQPRPARNIQPKTT